MSLKSQLLQFLSRMPFISTVRDRMNLLAHVGFEHFKSKIIWDNQNTSAFSYELLELLCSDGQSHLVTFLRNLIAIKWVGLDDNNKLAKFANDIQALTKEQWEKEFLGYLDSQSSSHTVVSPQLDESTFTEQEEELKQSGGKAFSECADSQSSSRVPFVLPQLDESTFTGREKELKQLEEQLFNQSGSHVCSIVGLSGGGGIGKSALARHFATIHKDKFPDGIIGLRVDGKTPDQIARQFVYACLKFSGEQLDLEEEQDAATLMQETFAHRRMLLIFDGAVDASIKQLSPSGNLCSVIITTRNRNLSALLDIPMEGTINLDPLPEEKAYQLLGRILGVERVKVELEAAYDIIRLVGCLPLALQITGKMLRNTSQSLANYRDLLQQEKTRLSLPKVWGDDDLNVTASLNLNLKDLSQNQKDFFACLSVCAEDGFTRRTAAAAGGCQNEADAQDYLQVLYDLSLLNSAQTGENRFVFHPLVRVYAKNLPEDNNLLAIAQERHAKFFIEWLQSNELENSVIIPQVAENLDDVILAAQWLQNQNQESLTEQDKKERYEFILKLQPLFEENGYYEKAIKLMKTFQSWAKEAKDWNAVVKYQMHEARYLSFAEEFKKAEEIIEKAKENLENLKSLEQRKYKERNAELLNVLGRIFQKQGKIEKAIEAFKKQQFIYEEIGNDQALVTICIRLGRLLQSQRKLQEADKYFKRAIELSEQQFSVLMLAMLRENDL